MSTPPTPGSLALTTLILRALAELGARAAATDELAVAGWRLALVVAARPSWSWSTSYEHAGAKGLALALGRGDLAEAERSALWVVDPDAAMEAAVAKANAPKPAPAANDAPFTLTAATLPLLGIEQGPCARRTGTRAA